MSYDSECDLFALGEPAHDNPAFGAVRNQIFARLVDAGFRSIALETDRVAALAVNDYVSHGIGDLDDVMRAGFSHDFGALDANRRLVVWMRDHPEQLTFHGFDPPTENTSAPSPRSYLEYARDYLGLDHLDIAAMAGDDHRWSRDEAILDFGQSMGATPEAERLKAIGADLRTSLYARAPELVAHTSRDAWRRARTHLDAGLGLLHYHWQAARPLPRDERIPLLMSTRSTLMAHNLLDIRDAEASRGPTMLFAHTFHLLPAGEGTSAGAIVDALGIGRYHFADVSQISHAPAGRG
ncbi:erythromycin esterase family protein [Asanoa sp. WMMD1127]|uniref:erythromycin esterase family protein n=1 Tax=Asanoa sp. WMMD1127 TaxID=3016107 RepID=UPI002416A9CE|nr:erythromycin esterase family protein [Asanoa sp. WMMD1127]MDG4824891.1 erythromycin esterase family protein [Asanoa sp. WMMD1127]